jgi:hypothetical protein
MIRRALLALLVVSLLGGVAVARYIKWKPKDKPPVSLAQASALADDAVKKEKGEFFCIAARLGKSFTQGDWEFHYSSATGDALWVSVGSDKSVKLSKEGFEY